MQGEVIVTDPITGQQGALNGSLDNTTNGTQAPGVKPGAGKGTVVNGNMSRQTTEVVDAKYREDNEEVEGLLHTPFNRTVTIQGYPDTVFNQMFRTMGFREVKSPVFGSYSIDQRKSADFVVGAVTVTVADARGQKVFKPNAVVTIKVADYEAFHVTDQITFKGVNGYDKDEKTHYGYWLNAYVCGVNNRTSEIEVVFTNLNAPTTGAGAVSTVTIPDDTEILILGHALAEEDAHVPPTSQLPEPTTHYMQKFMCMSKVSKMWQESEKNVDWGLSDIKLGVSRDFILEVEKTILFGHKAYFKDPNSGKMIRTTGGIFEQLLEEGVEVLQIWKEDLTDESIIETMKTVFVGNRGSERRYMLTGMDFSAALFSLKSMQKQVNTNASKREYTYTWDMWKLFNYTIQNKPYALFDMLGLGNWAFVFDKSNIEYCVFRAMDEDQLDLNKLMIEDSDALRCCEISSLVVKYAKCHRLIVMHDGNSREYDASTNPTGNKDGSRDKKRYAA